VERADRRARRQERSARRGGVNGGDGARSAAAMNVLVIDVGGSHVKIMATGHADERRMVSGPALTAAQMVSGVRALARGWKYDAVAIGFPGPVLHDRPAAEPVNLGGGWVGFDFARAFRRPVRMVNDAAMQALGGYNGGKMLFLGFGTGLGTTLIVDGVVVPMELAHLPYRKATFEDYVGERALLRFGRRKWEKYAFDVIARLTAAFDPDDIVLGGGNAAKLRDLPPRCRIGANTNAFPGGFRLWSGGGRRAPAKTAAAKRAGAKAARREAAPRAAPKAAPPKAREAATPKRKAAVAKPMVKRTPRARGGRRS
jgi:polyphosphate glucokinase